MTTYLNVSYSTDILSRKPLRYFFTDSIPIIPSFTDLIKSLITFLITIPFPHSDLALNSTLSDSISQPQELNSNSSQEQFISIPWQLPYSPEEILLPICLTLFTDSISDSISNYDPIPIYILAKKKYKLVHLKIKPVIGELPDKFRIVRNIIGNPLKDLPTLPTDPPKFKPTGCYTWEKKDKFDEVHPGFLWPPEQHLLHYFMMIHNDAFAWDNSECGHFREDFFPPVNIPISYKPYKPWIQCNIPIPPGIYEELCKVVKQKLDAGVFKPSNSSYRSRWFCLHSSIARASHSSYNCTFRSTPIHRTTHRTICWSCLQQYDGFICWIWQMHASPFLTLIEIKLCYMGTQNFIFFLKLNATSSYPIQFLYWLQLVL